MTLYVVLMLEVMHLTHLKLWAAASILALDLAICSEYQENMIYPRRQPY